MAPRLSMAVRSASIAGAWSVAVATIMSALAKALGCDIVVYLPTPTASDAALLKAGGGTFRCERKTAGVVTAGGGQPYGGYVGRSGSAQRLFESATTTIWT